jgi:hypothetical protein
LSAAIYIDLVFQDELLQFRFTISIESENLTSYYAAIGVVG